MIEIPKTQFQTDMQISIRQIFERESSLNFAASSSRIKNFTSLIALSENIAMTDIVENIEQLSNEQIEKQLRMTKKTTSSEIQINRDKSERNYEIFDLCDNDTNDFKVVL